MVFWRRGSCDVRVGFVFNVAILKPSNGWAEDKVGSALDVAVLEVKPGVFNAGVDCVLVSEETAVDEYKAVTLCMQGYSLSEAWRTVLYGYVFQSYVIAFNLQCVCGKSAELVVVGQVVILDIGMVIVGDDCFITVFTANLNVCQERRDDEFFFVYTFFYVYHFMVFHESPTYVDGLVDVAELTAAVACNYDSVGIVPDVLGGTGFGVDDAQNDGKCKK